MANTIVPPIALFLEGFTQLPIFLSQKLSSATSTANLTIYIAGQVKHHRAGGDQYMEELEFSTEG
jgi:hypothetical protein